MDAERRLTQAFLQAHPEDAARRLERLGSAEIAAFLEEMSLSDNVEVLERMAPAIAAECLGRMSTRRAGSLLGQLSLDTAASLLRRLQETDQERLLQAAAADAASSLRLMLRFPEGTAGALMDPRALCVPEDTIVRRAREQVRRSAQNILYYLYVVDRERMLVGVLSLRQLFLAPGKEPVSAVMTPHAARLSVSADQGAILTHPGWRDYHALPVVDAAGRFVGTIRYAILRKLEEQREPPPSSAQALSVALALGELYWLAVGGMVRNLWPDKSAEAAAEEEGRKTDGA